MSLNSAVYFFLLCNCLHIISGEYLVNVELLNYTVTGDTTAAGCSTSGGQTHCSPLFRLCHGEAANLTCATSRAFSGGSHIQFGLEGSALVPALVFNTLPAQYVVEVEVKDSVQQASVHHFTRLTFAQGSLLPGTVTPVHQEEGVYRLSLQVVVQCNLPFVGPQCQCKAEGNVLCNVHTGQTYCATGYSGPNCQHQDSHDGCAATHTCENGGTCQVGADGHSFTCRCLPGYSGPHCQVNIDECSSSPCQHGGSCIDGVAGFTCVCPSGYFGQRCEMTISGSLQAPCQNGGVRLTASANCTCRGEYTGDRCQFDVNECYDDPPPCRNGGHCVNLDPGYVCQCGYGFTGAHCELDLTDQCGGRTCLNGGTCHYVIGASYCLCPRGYKGDSCETDVNECASNPCQNGATCVNGQNSFHCVCAQGFLGEQCQSRNGDPLVG